MPRIVLQSERGGVRTRARIGKRSRSSCSWSPRCRAGIGNGRKSRSSLRHCCSRCCDRGRKGTVESLSCHSTTTSSSSWSGEQHHGIVQLTTIQMAVTRNEASGKRSHRSQAPVIASLGKPWRNKRGGPTGSALVQVRSAFACYWRASTGIFRGTVYDEQTREFTRNRLTLRPG